MNTSCFLTAALLAWLAAATAVQAQNYALPTSTPGDRMLQHYFETETARLRDACLADVQTHADWEAKRNEYRRQLQEMLGLWPTPVKTDLKPVITGEIEREGLVVEKLQFQSLPGLYVTANLYRPKEVPRPLPTILYVCGHALMKTNGVSFGNKTGYQHHGEWFARHGYVCLLIDTLQLGEIEGLHHGTHREGMWWWNSRGYSPAGIEAWNSIRALDYLETRPEVDRTRFGMTGRSGGGSYTWTTAALDDRIRVAAPVAGITDLSNYVVDGCVEGHCDCMFFVNTYRWDYPLNATLIAPRPLLIVNTDADTIFPLDGVVRTHAKVKQIYSLLGASDKLGLVIGPGPHKDTQNLQVPVFRWFNQHLKGEDPLIQDAAQKRFEPAELAVFAPGALPSDQINTRIHESFVPATTNTHPPSLAAVQDQLRAQCFRGWPQSPSTLDLRLETETTQNGIRLRQFGFSSQPEVSLPLWIASPSAGELPKALRLEILGEADWPAWSLAIAKQSLKPEQAPANSPAELDPAAQRIAERLADVRNGRALLAILAPRGIGPTAWTAEPKKVVQIRRRFMLLGQTLDGMRVWDIRRGVQATREAIGPSVTLELAATHGMAVNALYAALFEEGLSRLDLRSLPPSHRNGPDYLNVLKILDLPQAEALARERGWL